MKSFTHVALLFGLLSMASCKDDVIEDEDYCLNPAYKVPLGVTINLDDSFHDHCLIDSVFVQEEVPTRATKNDSEDICLVYYAAAFPQNPLLPTVVASSLEPVVPISIHPGKYRIVGWVDYEYPSKSRGLNFYTDDFNELLLKNKYNYIGASRLKLGYRGAVDRTIAYNASAASVDVSPAMGLYKLVATDSATYTPAKVVVKYASMLPAAINAKDGTINWWWDDISYSSTIEEDLLAADFVFSQNTETSVTVAVEIFDENGNLRARKRNLKIPLVNGGITTVKGNFYSILDPDPESTIGGGGISIKTEWDATFEIEL